TSSKGRRLKKNVFYMKNVFVLLFLTTIVSCATKVKEEKFIFTSGEQKVELKILNGNQFLEDDTHTREDFEWTNIDRKTSYIIGLGISVLGSENETTKAEVNIPKNRLESDTLKIKVRFLDKNEEPVITEFKVPVKDKNE